MVIFLWLNILVFFPLKHILGPIKIHTGTIDVHIVQEYPGL